jgi:hypothetical protein
MEIFIHNSFVDHAQQLENPYLGLVKCTVRIKAQ